MQHHKFFDTMYDFDDDIELHFLHQRVLHDRYLESKALDVSDDRVDRYTRVMNREITNILGKIAETGSLEFARPSVQTYDTDLYEQVNEDFTMCWKKTIVDHDTLIIHPTSYAGHDGRLTSSLGHVGDKLTAYDTDLLIINEDPFRMPEILYPSNLVLGCSERLNTIEKMCDEIKTYIKKEYKDIIIYVDSKHVCVGLNIAFALSDLNVRVLATSGQTSLDWDTSAWVKKYIKWADRPEALKAQFLPITPEAIMHLVKTYKFKQMGIAHKTLDPFSYLNEYDIRVDYYYGKYDNEYYGFKSYIAGIDCERLTLHEVDYKISDAQTHNIKPHIERKIFPSYLK